MCVVPRNITQLPSVSDVVNVEKKGRALLGPRASCNGGAHFLSGSPLLVV